MFSNNPDAPNRTNSLVNREGTALQPRVDSQALLGGRREVVIVHAGREYRLRLTQNGKLILTA